MQKELCTHLCTLFCTQLYEFYNHLFETKTHFNFSHVTRLSNGKHFPKELLTF